MPKVKRVQLTEAQRVARAERRRQRRVAKKIAEDNYRAGADDRRAQRRHNNRAQRALERTLEDNVLQIATERMQRNMRPDTLTEQVRQALARRTGITPLEYLMSLLRDPAQSVDVKIDAAKAAAPYCHRKLPLAVETTHTHKLDLDPAALKALSAEELQTLRALLLKTGLVRNEPETAVIDVTAERIEDGTTAEPEEPKEPEEPEDQREG